MAYINLLPWREDRRKELQNQFITFLAIAAVIAAGVVFFLMQFFDGRTAYQNSRNQYIETEIKKLDKEIAKIKELQAQKDKYLERMRVIQDLQKSRPQIVHVIEELVTTKPQGIYLTSISQKGNTIKIAGKSESHARVSAFMRELDNSEWFKEPRLIVIKENKTGGIQQGNVTLSSRDFELSIKQDSPKTTEEEQ